MFHIHSSKEPPPKRMCETIKFASEVGSTIASQQSQPPPIQRQVDQSTASEAVEINITEPFQPADFNFPKKALWQTESRISIQVVFGIFLSGCSLMSQRICPVFHSRATKCKIKFSRCQKQIRNFALYLEGFQTGKRR